MTLATPIVEDLFLVPVDGEPMPPLRLRADSRELTLGRLENCDLRTPMNVHQVSRRHAVFRQADLGVWHVVDLESRWGTFLNGVKLQPHRPMLLHVGDVLRIAPWTFRVATTDRPHGMRLPRGDATAAITLMERGPAAATTDLSRKLLEQLITAGSELSAADDEAALCAHLVGYVRGATGMENACVLRPMDLDDRYDVIACAGDDAFRAGGGTFSRTMVRAAAAGKIAVVGNAAPSASAPAVASVSIRERGITSGICCALTIEDRPFLFLYADSRMAEAALVAEGLVKYVAALANVASLALAAIKRREMQYRESELLGALQGAELAQRRILPPRVVEQGRVRITGECRPGQYIGGDFFDVIPLGEHRVAVVVGDVCGKGVAASVLMSVVQGFLHASLGARTELTQAITQLNAFVAPRCGSNRFVTVWAGVIDTQVGELTYVDAGHGHALMLTGGAEPTHQRLSQGGGLPIGMDDTARFESVTLPLRPGIDRLLLMSDGVIEQFPSGGNQDDPGPQFSMDGVLATVKKSPADLVTGLFDAVQAHAGGAKIRLSDDATIVLADVQSS